MHYLEANAFEPLDLRRLAERASMSPFHFLREYAQSTGETPIATLRRVRLLRACTLLDTQPMMPIDEVAALCGYGSGVAFARAFGASFGLTPSQWRRRPPPLTRGAAYELVRLAQMPSRGICCDVEESRGDEPFDELLCVAEGMGWETGQANVYGRFGPASASRMQRIQAAFCGAGVEQMPLFQHGILDPGLCLRVTGSIADVMAFIARDFTQALEDSDVIRSDEDVFVRYHVDPAFSISAERFVDVLFPVTPRHAGGPPPLPRSMQPVSR